METFYYWASFAILIVATFNFIWAHSGDKKVDRKSWSIFFLLIAFMGVHINTPNPHKERFEQCGCVAPEED